MIWWRRLAGVPFGWTAGRSNRSGSHRSGGWKNHEKGGNMSEIILETSGLTKQFRGFVAVKDVNLKIRRGTIHALIGPNGAGKSTVFNLLTKFLTPSAGSIHYKGKDITRMRPADIARLGMIRSFQISAVFPHLSVLENVRVALQR
jgi:branched-chain amino acid transport system ATP-binding protein